MLSYKLSSLSYEMVLAWTIAIHLNSLPWYKTKDGETHEGSENDYDTMQIDEWCFTTYITNVGKVGMEKYFVAISSIYIQISETR